MGDWDPFADPAAEAEEEAPATSSTEAPTARAPPGIESARAYAKDDSVRPLLPDESQRARSGALRRADDRSGAEKLAEQMNSAGGPVHRNRAAPKKPSYGNGTSYGLGGGIAALAGLDSDSSDEEGKRFAKGPLYTCSGRPHPSSQGTTAASSDDGGVPRQGDDIPEVLAIRKRPGKFSSAVTSPADALGRRKAGGFSAAVSQAAQVSEGHSEQVCVDVSANSAQQSASFNEPSFEDMLACLDTAQQRDDAEYGRRVDPLTTSDRPHSFTQAKTARDDVRHEGRDNPPASSDHPHSFMRAKPARHDMEQQGKGSPPATSDNPNSFMRAKPVLDKTLPVNPARDTAAVAKLNAEHRPTRHAVLSHAPTDPRSVVLNWGEMMKPTPPEEENPPDLEELLRQIDDAAGESGEAEAETPGSTSHGLRAVSSATPAEIPGVDELLARLDGEESGAAPALAPGGGAPNLEAMLAQLDAEESGAAGEEIDATPGIEALLAAVDRDEEHEAAERDREVFFGLGALEDDGPDVRELQGTKRALARLIGRTTDLDVRQVPGLWDPSPTGAAEATLAAAAKPQEANRWLISRTFAPAGPTASSCDAGPGRRRDR